MINADSELQALRLTSEVYSSPRLKPEISGTANTTNISNINASHQEDENLIRTRRDIIIPMHSPTAEPRLRIELLPPAADKPSKNLREKLRGIMSSKLVEITVIILIIIYMLIVVVNILLDDGSFNSDQDMDDALQDLKYLELAILSLFTLEIVLKVWAFGLRGYFKDCWYILDAVIIVVTFALVILDIELNESKFSGLSKIRVLFRLFRIFMLMRKADQFSRITKSRIRTTGVDFKSPVEKILELLVSLKLSIRDKALAKEIDWAIDIISNNKLYEPLIEPSEGKAEEKADASLWLKAYSKAAADIQDNQDLKLNIMDYSQRMSILTPGAAKKDACNLLAAPISQEAINMLDKDVDSITFDVFAFKNTVKENELVYMACYLFQKRNLFQYLNISQFTFTKFIKKIQSGYLPNLFHNSIHATDVLQTTNYFIGTGDFATAADLSNLEIAAMYISAAIHDYDHPGTNNAFQINIGSMTAIRYNDKAVLENHHVSAAFALLKDDSLNIFNNFSKADFKVIRERIIAMVLGTDMASHFSDVAKLKGRLAADFDIKTKDKNFCMELLIHAADISNPTKCWKTSCEWTTRVMQEFFDQGDQERNLDLPITHLCDKYTVNTAKSQTGFIDFVVAPFFGLLKGILPKIEISNIEINKNIWKDQIDHYENELIKLNEKKDTRKMLS